MRAEANEDDDGVLAQVKVGMGDVFEDVLYGCESKTNEGDDGGIPAQTQCSTFTCDR